MMYVICAAINEFTLLYCETINVLRSSRTHRTADHVVVISMKVEAGVVEDRALIKLRRAEDDDSIGFDVVTALLTGMRWRVVVLIVTI